MMPNLLFFSEEVALYGLYDATSPTFFMIKGIIRYNVISVTSVFPLQQNNCSPGQQS
jgi:hypothetical protein